MSDLINTTAPAPPPEAFSKDLPIGQPVSQDMVPVNTVWAKLSDGSIASLPASSLDALKQTDPAAQILPVPKPGEALVKLDEGMAGTLPLSSLDAARQQYPNLKVLTNGSGSADMQHSIAGRAAGAVGAAVPYAKAAVQGVGDPIQGIGAGALETAATIGKGITDPIVRRFASPEAIAQSDANIKALTTPDNTMQSVGKGIEGIGEFVAGDEALKGASLATKLGLAAKIAKLAEESPTAGKIINAGLNILRATGVSAAQSALHPQDGQSESDAALQGAAYGAAGGTVGEALGAGANALFKKTPAAIEATARQGVNQATTEAAEAVAKDQFNLQSVMSSLAERAAEQHGVPWPATGDTGAFWTFNDAADAIRKASEPVFDGLRQATPITDQDGNVIGNTFDRLTTEIKAAKKVIYGQPSSAQAYLNAEKMLNAATAKFNVLFENGVDGISKGDLDAAKSAWSAQSTLDDLGDAIDRAYLKTANLRSVASEETLPFIDPRKFVTNLNNGVRKIEPQALETALGGTSQVAALADLSDTLQKSAADAVALTRTEQAVRQAIASGKYGTSPEGKGLGITGSVLSGGALTGLAHLFGASNPISGGIGLSLGTLHWLYTHPTAGTKIIRAASTYAPIGSQAAKQGITHIYHPDGTLEAVPQQ